MMVQDQDELRERINGSLPALRASDDPLALVPVEEMAPHYISFSSKITKEGYIRLFSVGVDGTVVHVYLKQG